MERPTAKQLTGPRLGWLDRPVGRPVSWRGGPQLDPEAEDAYRAEQADYE